MSGTIEHVREKTSSVASPCWINKIEVKFRRKCRTTHKLETFYRFSLEALRFTRGGPLVEESYRDALVAFRPIDFRLIVPTNPREYQRISRKLSIRKNKCACVRNARFHECSYFS